MKKIAFLFKSGKISKIPETEKLRYLNFFSNSCNISAAGAI